MTSDPLPACAVASEIGFRLEHFGTGDQID